MKSIFLFCLLFLALKTLSEQKAQIPQPEPSISRQLQLDENKTGDPELMESKMDLYDELENADNQMSISKSELDYFNGVKHKKYPQPEIIVPSSESLIVRNPTETIVSQNDPNEEESRHYYYSPLEHEISEIEETHDYLIQHDMVLDLHNRHLQSAFTNLAALEQQFQDLAKAFLKSTDNLKVDANTRNLVTNFADHLAYIEDEEKYENENRPPLLYDYYIEDYIDLPKIAETIPIEIDEMRNVKAKIEDLKFSASNLAQKKTEKKAVLKNRNMRLGFSAAKHVHSHHHVHFRKGVSVKRLNAYLGSKITAKKDVSGEYSPAQLSLFDSRMTRVASPIKPLSHVPRINKDVSLKHHTHKHFRYKSHSFSFRKVRSFPKFSPKSDLRKTMLVDTDTGIKFPFQHERNPWSKTRFPEYRRPTLHGLFSTDDIVATRASIDELTVYYTSTYALLLETDSEDSNPMKPDTLLHTYARIKNFSTVGFFVLQQIWNDLNQISADFHTIPDTYLNTVAFYQLADRYNILKCKIGNDTSMAHELEDALIEDQGTYRNELLEVLLKIEDCETDVFRILDISEFYRNFKGHENVNSPVFDEFLTSSKTDYVKLSQLKTVVIGNVLQLDDEVQKLELLKNLFELTLEKFEKKFGGSGIMKGLILRLLAFLYMSF